MLSPLQRRQALCFALTLIAYASTYLLRKPLGVIRADLGAIYGLSDAELRWLDTLLLLPNAVMQIHFAYCGDRYGPRIGLTFCLIGSALSMCTFGFWHRFPIFAVLLFLNGSSLATAWPNCVKSLGSWFNKQQRTTIFGFFFLCILAGEYIGSALAVQVRSTYGPDLKMTFLIPSIIVGVIGVLVFLFMRSPEEEGMIIPGQETKLPKEKTLSYMQLWNLGMVPELAWANFSVKLVGHCMYMWLPMYLFQSLGYSKTQAGLLSTVFEIGRVFGYMELDTVIDRFFPGRTVHGVFITVLGSTFFLAAFYYTSHILSIGTNCLFMFLAGFCICGPDPYLSGSIAASVGERENAQAAVSGLINGFGSIGAVIEGPLIGWMKEHYSWTMPFYFMIGLSTFGTLCMYKASRIEDAVKKSQFMSQLTAET